jgi:hypothetical protein
MTALPPDPATEARRSFVEVIAEACVSHADLYGVTGRERARFAEELRTAIVARLAPVEAKT